MCDRGRIVGRAEPHPGRQPGHREAERLEDRGEERVLLETIAAARPATSLAWSACKSSEIGSPEQDVEILERDAGRVRQVEAAQCFERRIEMPE